MQNCLTVVQVDVELLGVGEGPFESLGVGYVP